VGNFNALVSYYVAAVTIREHVKSIPSKFLWNAASTFLGVLEFRSFFLNLRISSKVLQHYRLLFFRCLLLFFPGN
jgi:hypothetical protein